MLRPLQQGIRCVRKQHYIVRVSINAVSPLLAASPQFAGRNGA